jgi:hypothetical protein
VRNAHKTQEGSTASREHEPDLGPQTVRIRAQSKMVKGRSRWYLVQSYRDAAGRSRTKWLVYLGGPPNYRIKKFIAGVNKHPMRDYLLPLFREEAKKHVRYMREKRKVKRSQHAHQLRRRRSLYAAHKAGLPILRKNDVPSFLRHWRWNLEQLLQQKEAEPLFGNQKHAPKVPEDLQQRISLRVERFAELMAGLKAKLTGKPQPETKRTDTPLRQDQDKETPAGKFGKLIENFKMLDEREELIIRGRFGLDDGTVKTLAALAARLRISRERVRQIQKIAQRKLRYAQA